MREAKSTNIKTCGVALLFALTSAAALAQSAPPASGDKAEARQKMRTACAADIQKFCANIERGKGATRTCLEQHQAELSTQCNAARAERAAMKAQGKS
jgi:hypothetical protein